MRILVIGASGRVGREVVAQAVERGHQVSALTRTASTVERRDGVAVVEGEATDGGLLRRILRGHDAVVFALGTDKSGPTTLFSDATRELLAAMAESGVDRLVAVTGVGAGETRGHGGWLYDRVIFPLFTRERYADKDRQEALIAASATRWTVVRPGPFSTARAREPFEAIVDIRPDTRITKVSTAEVATFVLDDLETGAFIGRKPFIGHRR